MSDTFRTFEEFWPFYVREHSKALTRWLHFAGTSAAMACLTSFAKTRRLWLLPTALVLGYGPAWFSHFVIEKNRPATFKHPYWSLRADMKMFDLMRRGKMNEEVARVMGAAKGSNGAAHADPAAEGVRVRAAGSYMN